jgi:hypothetical protein
MDPKVEEVEKVEGSEGKNLVDSCVKSLRVIH